MPLESNTLVTGAGSGLGKYIASQIDCVGMTRDNAKEVLQKNNSFDLIIHCAFNATRNTNDYYKVLQDNIFLTKSLALLPHSKFVFLSSIDVYQKEDDLYKTTKLMAESIVNKIATNPLILRSSAIIGPMMRKSSLIKILEDNDPQLSLSKDSTFNYVLQSDILSMIQLSAKNNYSGIIDFVSSENIKLQDVAENFDKQVTFGQYTYETPIIPNGTLQAKFPPAWHTSLGNIERFIKEKEK